MDSKIDKPEVSKELFSLTFLWKNDVEKMDVESPRQLDQTISLVSDLRQAYKVWPFVDVIYIPDLNMHIIMEVLLLVFGSAGRTPINAFITTYRKTSHSDILTERSAIKPFSDSCLDLFSDLSIA